LRPVWIGRFEVGCNPEILVSRESLAFRGRTVLAGIRVFEALITDPSSGAVLEVNRARP